MKKTILVIKHKNKELKYTKQLLIQLKAQIVVKVGLIFQILKEILHLQEKKKQDNIEKMQNKQNGKIVIIKI